MSPAEVTAAPDRSRDSPGSIFIRFLKFGALAWGGPAAQIAMIKHECGDEEGWVSEESFKKTLAVFQILPWEDLEHGQGLLEALLGDPALLVAALVLDHRDLRRGAPPGQCPELQETNEDRAGGVSRSVRSCGDLGRGHGRAVSPIQTESD